MDIILPVAGLGSRLRPQTWSKPKPLVALAGKPMLEHVLDRVMPLNPEKIVFITGYLGEQIEEWARATYDLPMVFVEQPEMRGQTDAIIRTQPYVADDALILFPDMLFEADFSVISSLQADGVLFTKEVDDPSALGVAVLDGDTVVRLVEKPQQPISNLAIIGIYYFKQMAKLYTAIEEQMARGIMLKNEFFIADAIQLMIDQGSTIVTAPVTVWEDCGNSEALLSTNRYLLKHQPPTVAARAGSVIVPPSFVAESAILENAVIGPYASIGDEVIVKNSVVRDAIVESGSAVEDAVVDHSIIGLRAQLRGRPTRVNVSDLSIVEL